MCKTKERRNDTAAVFFTFSPVFLVTILNTCTQRYPGTKMSSSMTSSITLKGSETFPLTTSQTLVDVSKYPLNVFT